LKSVKRAVSFGCPALDNDCQGSCRMENNEGLKRKVGVWGLSANIVNIMVGAGIFVLPAIVAEGLGPAAVLAYLFCGFLITIIMLCFAEIGSSITLSGGAYAYIELAFGKYAGFLTANLFVFGAAVMADAAVANALADTLAYLFPIFKSNLFRPVFFVLIFSGLAYINVRGVKEGITLVKVITAVKLTPLILLVIAGWPHVSAPNLVWDHTPSLRELGEISLILFFAFQGSETGLNIGGEIKKPQKTIPKGILISIFGVLLLYILIQTIAQGILGSALSGFKDAPLAEAAKYVFGPYGVTLMLVCAAFSMFGNLSGEVLNLPRVIFRASGDGVIRPALLSRVHKKYATPHLAIISYAALACIFSITGEFRQLAILSSAAMLLIYLGVACAVIKFRRKEKAASGSFKIPGGIAVPVAAILTIFWFLSNLSLYEQAGIVLFMLLLSIIYLLLNARNEKR
jgi:APA family basic amino acid/polyamine antiporter